MTSPQSLTVRASLTEAGSADLRLRRATPSMLSLFTTLSLVVFASPFLLHTVLTSDWSPFWQLTWLGFDAAMAAALVVVGVGAARNAPWLEGSAAIAASLLACDAFVDVVTAADARHMVIAAITAVTLELPLMALCLAIACPSEPARRG